VGKHRVVGRVGADIHDLAEFVVVGRFHAQIGLTQRINRIPVDAGGNPLTIQFVGDGTLMGSVDRESPFSHTSAVIYTVAQRSFRDFQVSEFITIAVLEHAVVIYNLLNKQVHKIGKGTGVHPASFFVKTLVDKKLSPGGGTVDIQTFLAGQMIFTTEKETGVWVDQQQGIAVGTQVFVDGNAVGARGFIKNGFGQRCRRQLRNHRGPVYVEGRSQRQLLQF